MLVGFMSSCDSHSRWNSGNDVVCDVGVCGEDVVSSATISSFMSSCDSHSRWNSLHHYLNSTCCDCHMMT